MIAKVGINKYTPVLIPLRTKSQIRIIKTPERINLGCINVKNPNMTELINKCLANFLSFFSTKSLTINPDAIKNPEAARLSYPTTIEASDRVGFNIININTV